MATNKQDNSKSIGSNNGLEHERGAVIGTLDGSPESDNAVASNGTGIDTGIGSDGTGVGGHVNDSSTRRTRRRVTRKEESDSSIEVEPQPEVKTPKQPKTRTPRKSKAADTDGTIAAKGLLEMVELFAVTKFGAAGFFSPEERFFIEGSLARLIEKYGGAADRYSSLIDPIMVVIGAVLYGRRLIAVVKPASTPPVPNPAGESPEMGYPSQTSEPPIEQEYFHSMLTGLGSVHK